MILRYRAIQSWPGKLLDDDERQRSQFSAPWPTTLELLDHELWNLGVEELVIELAVAESAIRLDGSLRTDRRPPEHPGVILSFRTERHGPLRYWTDSFTARAGRPAAEGWRENVRAIALGLEALRKLDRYGIANRGEQYTGWKALGSGIALGAATMTADEAATVLAEAAEMRHQRDRLLSPEASTARNAIERLYRQASKQHHPDVGGDAAKFRKITEARDLLLATAATL